VGERHRRIARAVSTRVSPYDAMHGGAGRHYFSVGQSGLACVEATIEAAGLEQVTTVLDLPCGHGRVLRWLRARFPAARLTVSDLDRDGVDFCARAFDAQPVYSRTDLDALDLGDRFDLIWCGSLATHLNADAVAALLTVFERHLANGGVAVVTTHGARTAERLGAADPIYAMSPAATGALLRSYETDGFGYADYPGQAGYGMSLSTPEWMRSAAAAAGLREVLFLEHGWDDHQDVFGLVRAD
jgi:SAM-dependent methyltransferase